MWWWRFSGSAGAFVPVFGGMQSLWIHLRVGPPSGSRCLLWEFTCSLPIGRPGAGSSSAGGALSSASCECRVPGFVELVLHAADRNHSFLSSAAVVCWALWVFGPHRLQVAERYSLRGGIAEFASNGQSWIGSQLAAFVVGYFTSGSLKLTPRGGLRALGEGNVRSVPVPSGIGSSLARKGKAGWLCYGAVGAVPSGVVLCRVLSG